jgi:tRNA pseudouridine38-40 synthase
MARRNFLLTLAYDGTNFHGWQRLSGAKPGAGRSVQGEVEACLAKVLGIAPRAEGLSGIEVVGAGRTDAGVHAEGQGASFHAFTSLSCEAIEEALNAVFPPDLECRACAEVDSRFHARLHAISKTYRYRLLVGPSDDPGIRRTSLRVAESLDLEAMRAAAALLVGERDFRALSNAKGEDTERRLDEVAIEAHDALVDLLFVGPGFIYNQVRVMAALLLEVGKGRIESGRVGAIIAGRDRRAAPGALGPYGLCLVEVRYRGDGGKSKDRAPL